MSKIGIIDLFPLTLLLICLWESKYHKDFNINYLSKNNTESLKSVAIFVVIFHNLSQRTGSGFLFRFFYDIGIYAVAIFLFISGYGLIKRRMSDKNYDKDFIKKRLLKVIVPYFIALIITCGIALIKKEFSIQLIISNLKQGLTFVEHSWYVIVIIVLYLAFYVVMKLFKDNYENYVYGMLIISLLLILTIRFIIHYPGYWYNTILCFFLGIVFGVYEEKLFNILKKPYFILIVVLLVLLFLFNVKKGWIISIIVDNGLFDIINALLFLLLAILLVMKFSIGNRILSFISNITFEMYLYHSIIYNFFRGTIYIKNEFIWCFLTLLTTILFAYIINKINNSIYKKIINS